MLKAEQHAELEYTERLKAENEQLQSENKELLAKLSAKRYKLIDTLVDGTYSVVKKIGLTDKRAQKTACEVNEAQKRTIKTQVSKPRKFVKGKVAIINYNFFDRSGKVVYKGGAERYVYDLAVLLKNLNYNVTIMQCSDAPFQKTYRGIPIIGIGDGDWDHSEYTSSLYRERCKDCEFVITSPLDLACELGDIPSIGINHGVDFDGISNRYDYSLGPMRHDKHLRALSQVQKCVCVDTNFIAWTRSQDYKLSLKEIYIPNYFNESQFSAKTARREGDKLSFVYPRRLYVPRGYDITIEAFRRIFRKYPDKAELYFVGQIDNDEVGRDVKAFIKEFPKNVHRLEYDMEDMDKAYALGDIVLIPTRCCEGTSLSCIEGMASGKAVIATNVGGLPDLIIDRYNGRLIPPTSKDLFEAAESLIKDRDLVRIYGERASEVARAAFEKKFWDERWKDCIESIHNKK